MFTLTIHHPDRCVTIPVSTVSNGIQRGHWICSEDRQTWFAIAWGPKGLIRGDAYGVYIHKAPYWRRVPRRRK